MHIATHQRIELYKAACAVSRLVSPAKLLVLATVLAAVLCEPAAGATLCVKPGGKSGCFATIGAAVAAAAPNDTILVAQGTYKEQVTITKPLSLVGANLENTIIDATGDATGIFINGTASAPNSGVTDVTVTGFTVENANFEGILVSNASNVTIAKNEVVNNDKALDAATGSCPGIPAFETNEGFDCGEGIHLTGVDHSIISGNVSEKNAGGILLSDDTGATHDNLIADNVVQDNPFDCGITLASHSPATITHAGLPLGVFHNTVRGNTSSGNGLGVSGAGAGVGLFAPGPGNKTYGNVVIDNSLTGNGLPGVTMHNHASFPTAPPVDLNDNVIVGNRISGNLADTEDAATPGPTGINIYSVAPVTGTVISGNRIDDEEIAVAVKTPSLVELHLNDFEAGEGDTGVDNLGTGAVNATENGWGCSGGPTAPGCASASGAVVFTPWLTKPASSHQNN
jgi:nitrous oxidase accessory protein NosD